MGSFRDLLTDEEAEAIHSYLIDLAWKTYEAADGPSSPHSGSSQEP